jgi:hypothetical protein
MYFSRFSLFFSLINHHVVLNNTANGVPTVVLHKLYHGVFFTVQRSYTCVDLGVNVDNYSYGYIHYPGTVQSRFTPGPLTVHPRPTHGQVSYVLPVCQCPVADCYR